MDLYELSLVKKIIINFPGNLVDVSDKINFIYSPSVFVISSILLFLRYLTLKPIFCWGLPEFSVTWVDYANNYCWVQSTFDLLPDGNFPPQNEKKYHNANYYQWVHIVLCLQSILFVLPFILWTILSKYGGMNLISNLPDINKQCQSKTTQELQQDLSDEVAAVVIRVLETRVTDYRMKYPYDNRFMKIKSKIENWVLLKYFRKRSGNSLIIYYMFIKMVFIGVSILQMWLMKVFLGNVRLSFGIDILMNIIRGNVWRNTYIFPRLVGCDLLVYQTGQSVNFSLLCVLPINMLIEKVFIFIWFWMVMTILITICSTIYWSIIILSKTQRENFIFKMLNMSKPIRKKSKKNADERTRRNNKLVMNFVNTFLRLDGVFLLRMVANNCSLFFTSFVAEDVWRKYNERRTSLSQS